MEQDSVNLQQGPPRRGFPWRNILYAVAVLVVVAGFVAFAVYQGRDDKKPVGTNNQTTHSQAGASLSLSPASGQVVSGQSITISLWEDSGDSPVNAVQAVLSYPADKFEFVSLESEHSPFEVEAEASHAAGKITISRGHVGELTGPQLVAKVTLKALTNSDSAKVSFLDGSVLLSSQTNQDIVGQKIEGNYTFKATE